MAGSAVEVVGLKEFRAALKAADSQHSKAMAKLHRDIARMVQPRAQSAAAGVGGSTRHFAGMARASGTQAAARITVAPKANAAFFGAKKRTGWNAGHGGKPQHPAWVGSGWEPGGPGGPYGINAAIQQSLPDIDRMAGDGYEDLYRKAFS